MLKFENGAYIVDNDIHADNSFESPIPSIEERVSALEKLMIDEIMEA